MGGGFPRNRGKQRQNRRKCPRIGQKSPRILHSLWAKIVPAARIKVTINAHFPHEFRLMGQDFGQKTPFPALEVVLHGFGAASEGKRQPESPADAREGDLGPANGLHLASNHAMLGPVPIARYFGSWQIVVDPATGRGPSWEYPYARPSRRAGLQRESPRTTGRCHTFRVRLRALRPHHRRSTSFCRDRRCGLPFGWRSQRGRRKGSPSGHRARRPG